MTGDSKDFEELRKLLATKQQEKPFPGFFNQLSDSVVDRLKKDYNPSNPWWRIMLLELEVKPALAGIYGLAILGMLGFGLLVSSSDDGASELTVFSNSPLSKLQPASSSELSGMPASNPLFWESHLTHKPNLRDFSSMAPETGVRPNYLQQPIMELNVEKVSYQQPVQQ
ncbi:MAG TPA: hypothetical protein EYQ50_15605 [Verrucomicrobiales bacterium]|jgi:hypothetical protein|nr:hypothetical protein [Verrucomicrobiales bacterium]HIL70573.1 hypothetical protein [Verrucomicrobiota bacterium]